MGARREGDLLSSTGTVSGLLLVAVAAFIGGGALALGTGDGRALLALALGVVAGGCAAAALAQPAAPRSSVERPPRSPSSEAAPTNAAQPTPTAVPQVAPAPSPAAVPDRPSTPTPAPVSEPAAAVRAAAPAAAESTPVYEDAPRDAEPSPALVGVAVQAEGAPAATPAGLAEEQAVSAPAEGDAALGEQPPAAIGPEVVPADGLLQGLAARQRSSTAELRRSIRDVIERLEDDETPPARRRRPKGPKR